MATAIAARPTEDVAGPGPLMNHRQILFVIYGLMAGMFLSSLDQTIVGTAIRTIGDDLNGLDQQAWVTTAYLIAATVTTPLYGKLSDIFGRRPLFIISISIFVAGSFLSSFSTSMLMLAGFRAFQGLGAGGLMSLPMAITGDILAPRERARYQGYFMATFGIASVIGPLVGGLFAGTGTILGIAGWRWVFLVNVPVGVLALFMVFSFLHLPHIPHGHSTIDWWGAGLVVGTLAPLLLIAEQGRDWGWTSPAAIICYAIGVAGLVAFLLVERAMGQNAIIPLALFDKKGFSPAIVLSILVGFGMFGAMMTIPLYLQIVLGLSPTQSGFASLPMMFGVMISSIGTGQVVARTGKYGIFPISGTAVTAGGFVILTFMQASTPYWFLAIAMFVIGLGLGQLMQTLNLAAQASVDAKDMGVASSSVAFFRSIGGTLGTAIMLSILFTVLPINIKTAMTDNATTWNALDAALDPAVASDPKNAGIMDKMWTEATDKIKDKVDDQLSDATKALKKQVKTVVRAKVTAVVAKKAAEGTGKLGDGASAISSGLDKLADGTGAFVAGVGKIGDGTSALAAGTTKIAAGAQQLATGTSGLASGLDKVNSGMKAAAGEASQAVTDYGTLAKDAGQLKTDSNDCASGDADACSKVSDDNKAVSNDLDSLKGSVGTASYILNGDGSAKNPGLAAGLAGLDAGAGKLATGTQGLATGLGKLATGTGKLATGVNTAASKGSAIPTGASALADGTGKIAAGAKKLSKVQQIIDKAVDKALPKAYDKALKAAASMQNLSVIDGKLAVDWSNPSQRQDMVTALTPTMIDGIKTGDSGSTDVKTSDSTSDTSFLNGADPRLTKPFMVGFNASVVTIYWVGLVVMLLALAVTLFYRVPPLRTRSALQEKADLRDAAAGAGPEQEGVA